jgi:hypothetical protein
MKIESDSPVVSSRFSTEVKYISLEDLILQFEQFTHDVADRVAEVGQAAANGGVEGAK